VRSIKTRFYSPACSGFLLIGRVLERIGSISKRNLNWMGGICLTGALGLKVKNDFGSDRACALQREIFRRSRDFDVSDV
jgi:hypothetical protein